MTRLGPALLEVRGLEKRFPLRRRAGGLFGPRHHVHAVNGVSFDVHDGETFGLVGESGSGKSTTGKVVARLLAPSAGEIRLAGSDWLALAGAALRRRRADVQMVFQNPFLSLDPRWTVQSIVSEPLRTHRIVPRRGLRERCIELLRAVGLGPEHLERYPHQFSGGQRQRIGLARALALQPKLLVADEPVSALDVSVQAQILKLFETIRDQHHIGMLFISHDLSVVRHVSDRVGVMYLGQLVEIGSTVELFRRPLHPYTVALLSAVPRLTPGRRAHRIPLGGEIPSPVHLPSGCPFHPRCPRAEARCSTEKPALLEHAPGQLAACHFPGDVGLPAG
jgi:oligopeptide/dipeptide ABC transporter ATP-binding protein